VRKVPEIDVQLAEELPRFQTGQTLTIKAAEIVKTQQRGFEGVRVVAVDDAGNEYAEMLWKRSSVGASSKLGCFIAVLGKNTDNWIGKKIKIVRWVEKDREIQVVEGKKR
jgi:hypothetical protein